MKFLLWAVLVYIVVMWLLRTRKAASGPQSGARRHNADAAETMVQCAHCGVHIPVSEAIHSDSGAVFCSQEHRLQFPG